ncbi:NAD(P)/FAD-dependent oxidoreductase [Chitinophagaceae bacterium MMS25-I14]
MNTKGTSRGIWPVPEHLASESSYTGDGQVFDVLVTGNNIAAFTAALLLQQQGRKCIIAAPPDAAEYGFAGFTTMCGVSYSNLEKNYGAATAHLIADALREAADTAEHIITSYEIDCDFVYEPGFVFSASDTQKINEEQLAAERAGLVTDMVHSIPVTVPFTAVCRFEFQARIHPGKYIAGLAKAFVQEGGVLLTPCEVRAIEKGILFEAETSAGKIQAHTICHFDAAIKGLQEHTLAGIAFTLKNGVHPYGMAADTDSGTMFAPARIGNKDCIIAAAADATPEALKTFVQLHFDIAEIESEWTTAYTGTPNGFPYISAVPGHEHQYIAAGTGINALSWESLAGKIISDKVLGREHACSRLMEMPAEN